jgi:pyruvate kinase
MHTRSKIVATLGPATESLEQISRLVQAGVDVFRLNFSHGTHEDHASLVANVRRAAEQAGCSVGILQDLQGPRIRTGLLRNHEPVQLEEGAQLNLRPGRFHGTATDLGISYPELAQDVSEGDRILLADGEIELEVQGTQDDAVRCRVVVGGELGERKGINLPGVDLGIANPTRKDIQDLRFGLEQGVDWVALSFVSRAGDVLRLKEEINRAGGPDVPVIPKIERPRALENLREILLVSDGVMVARGDLGIELPAEKVPAAQKHIIKMANQLGVPAITATQMLDSMIHSPRPTRAEASDVANAILDGTDAVMLSGETSIGDHPVRASPAPEIEGDVNRQQHALAEAACSVADELNAAGIVAFTQTGSTARYVSQRRPEAPVYALTPDKRTQRRLALLWGVEALMLDDFETTDEMVESGGRRLRELGLMSQGDTVVYVAGASTRTPGGTDLIKLVRFED